MAAKQNKGISALRSLDMNALTSGADLSEKISAPKAEKVNNKKFVAKALRIPEHLSAALVKMKETGKYTGSINAYITEAIRKQLIADGHLEQ